MQVMRNLFFSAAVRSCIVVALVATVLGWIFFGPEAGIFMLAACGALLVIQIHAHIRRYDALAALSQELDRILHSRNLLVASECEEGELSILRSEIHKLTVRMREQADQLAKDRTCLADAMADVSHQLRTPLTSLNLMVSLLGDPELTESRRTALCMDMSRLLKRLDWLVSSLLLMSKIDAGTARFQTETVSVTELVDRACAPLEIPMELRDIRCQWEVEDGISFMGDMHWCVEAVGNILKNAMEHTPVGGEIRVSAVENAIFTQLIISDSGPGIDPEDLPHLFERFYRGKDASDESVGIGLALAQMIVSAQNGTVQAANSPYGGARFIVRFYKTVV